ncbi:hypothetical protein [Gordonibacter sp. An230]|uniref:hypothetical protein n=1 Tax=Gordonibacter sp. An230 TaxID=1965592 RepID=UPI001120A67C|nr:hypothetical protein [Gordonibacter sp. An230]
MTAPPPAAPEDGGIAHALRSRPWGFWACACAACALAFSVLSEASSGNPAFPFGELLFWTVLLLSLCVLGRPPAARRTMGPAALAGSALYSLAGGALLSGLAALATVAVVIPSLADIPGADSPNAFVVSIMAFQSVFFLVVDAVFFGSLGVAGLRIYPVQARGVAKLGVCALASAVLFTLVAASLPSGGNLKQVLVVVGTAGVMTPFFLSCVLAVRRGWVPLVCAAPRRRPPARCAALAALLAAAALPAALLAPALELPFGAGLLSNFAYVGQGILTGEYASEEAAREALLWAFPHNAPALGVEALSAALAAALSLALAASALPPGSRAAALRRMPRALLSAAACVAFYEGAGLAFYRIAPMFGDGEAIMGALAALRAVAFPLALASAALLAARLAPGARDPSPAEGAEGAVGDAE